MSRQEAKTQYARALKEGRRCYRECVRAGRYPYLQVLDEILSDTQTQGTVDLGEVEIPIDQIAGTRESGRKAAFAADFMPLLDADTEFGMKWVSLCEAHLDDVGIQSPIRAFEYMGRFYVQEGNKRVSVMKSFGAMSITGDVVRIIPVWSDDLPTRVYYEYLDFYALSGVCQVHFNGLGGYAKIQAALGFDADHVWTADERRAFISDYYRFKRALIPLGLEEDQVTCAEALLVWLQVYPLSDLKSMSTAELDRSVIAVAKDIEAVGMGGPISMSMGPEKAEEGVIGRLIDNVTSPNRLTTAFVFESAPSSSLELMAHEQGMRYMERELGGRVSVSEHCAGADRPVADVMEEAAAGSDVLVATSPSLVHECRKLSARHPDLRVLSCSAAMPYAGVRTYSGRTHEVLFIAGAIAGALSRGKTLGYVANAPVLGRLAEVNAFSLGARLVDPDARVRLRWSGVAGDPVGELEDAGVRVIAHCDIPAPMQEQEFEGLSLIEGKGLERVLAVPSLNWGVFYSKLMGSILSGGWDALEARSDASAVSYWWGMASGVVDVRLGHSLPDSTRELAEMLREEIASNRISVFHRVVRRQDGTVFNDGSRWPTAEEILNMNWLCDGVEGSIPPFDELTPAARALVRVQGVYRQDLPPEKGGLIV
ncbi:MAG: BMP family ABC transporter substrate-binding protein [Atopobiaceae bacterium]|jgi:basic membrane lipoprotein Med (substrate-binding protein (PBP1-ABC) superfamily)|nr:BMP family ABC transporter substrate-binding protein [Atopobiaceae bacterium]MCI2172837.1 BMP family ABC transporter substrate-binding protein [Atopobiaceae bacterium]MCI2207144.1 BMP family ABC transporter substrate-binding protein [Atopobiaceae bacterium]